MSRYVLTAEAQLDLQIPKSVFDEMVGVNL
jgi:hypothetical protein